MRIDNLQKDKAPQYIDFLMSVTADKSGPLPHIQEVIADRLLVRHRELLPQVLVHMCMCICMCVCVCVCVCLCVCVCVCKHIHTHTHTRTHIHIYIYM